MLDSTLKESPIGDIRCKQCGSWIYPFLESCPYCGVDKPAKQIDIGSVTLMAVITAKEVCESCAKEHDLQVGVSWRWSMCDICQRIKPVRKVRDECADD